jgi:predicted O-methyltransferase YrrM
MRVALKAAGTAISTSRPELGLIRQAFELAAALKPGSDTAAFRAIERRRRDLGSRRGVVKVLDYGAGFSDRLATPEQQKAGVVGEISMSELVGTSSDAVWCRALYYLTRLHKPTAVLELGTCVGISGAYIAAALRANDKGNLWTLEGSPPSAELANETFDRLGLANYATVEVGPFSTTFDRTIEAMPSVDLAFIDGHHDGTATLGYFERLVSKLSDGSIVAFDDINYSPSMEDAWERIKKILGTAANLRIQRRGIVRYGRPKSTT